MYDVAELAVLPPQVLPASLAGLAECIDVERSALAEVVGPLAEPRSWDASELWTAARCALERVRTLGGKPIRIESDPAETPMNRENDKALHIFRTSGAPAAVLASSAVQAYVGFLDELLTSGSDLTVEEVGRIHQQFIAIFTMLNAGTASYDLEEEPTLAVSVLKPDRLQPLSRWVRGHHVFIVILQWQVILFQCLRHHVEQFGGSPPAGELLKLLILSMRAAVQAFRFTGEFNRDDYERLVRPTLMPPAAPDGMSGLNWRDHQYLIRNLTKLDRRFATADATLLELYASFKQELRLAYDAHKHVCARFVGTEAVSLLSKGSAVNVIERLKYLRTRLL